ncbi:MAG: hypothetical protein QOI61_786 [Actinomycetota bacterium]|jgi:hypothetical protein
MKTNHSLRKALAVGAGVALSLGLLVPAGASVTPKATDALDWLEAQMAANDHHLVSGYVDENDEFQTFDDTGLTIDALLALAAAGRASDTESQATADWVVGNVDAYVTGFDPEALYAGALGKAITFGVVYDLDPTELGGHDLEADLRSLLATNGRFKDKATDFQSGDPVDFSNGIGQAFDVLGLAASEDGAPASSVNYLLLQQCPNGGFRVQLGDTACADNATVDVDATSFALTALGAVAASDTVDDAITDGVAYLASIQDEDGSFEGNANSSGLAAATLRAYGDAPNANTAAGFVKTLQLTSGDDAGAILLDQDGYDAASSDGLDEPGRTVAARATAQGVMAFGLPAYSLIGERAPVEPSTTVTLSASSVPEGGTMTASGGGFRAGEKVNVVVSSDPVTVGTPTADDSGLVSQSFTLPASVTAGQHTVTLTGQDSGVTISSPFTVTAQQAGTTTTSTTVAPTGTTTTTQPSTVIARAGQGTTAQAQFGGALLAAGLGLVLATRRRRIIYPFKR